MKEARSPHPAIVFEERLIDAATAARNGGTVTAVTFANGVGTFNGSSAYIKYKLSLKGTYTIRIKFTSFTPVNNGYVFDFRNSSGTGTGYIQQSSNATTITMSSGTAYINGSASTTINSSVKEIVISGITLNCYEIFLATRYSVALFSSCSIDLIQIYKGTLTAAEVRNLYSNKTFKELAPSATKYPILDVSAFSGSIVNRANSTAITNTNVTIVNDGGVKVMKFNGTDSKLDCGAYNTLVGDITVSAWVKNLYLNGILISNGKLYVTNYNSSYRCSSNGSTEVFGSNYVKKWDNITITRKADGKCSIYKNGTLVSIADGNSGTPSEGTTNIIIGRRTIVDLPFKGSIARVTIYSGILSADEIQQIFDSQRLKFGL